MRMIETFQTLVDKVKEVSQYHYDKTIRLPEMEFESLDSLRIGSDTFAVLPSAQRLLANRLRVPHSYLVRCPADLQEENLNYWLREQAKERETLFCRFAGNHLRAVFTDKYTAIDHTEILSKMAEYGFQPETEVHYSLDPELLVFKIPDYTRGFGSGEDRIIPGISVANSEVGVLALSIEAYFYRLVCSNGMIAKTEVTSRFKHISRRALEEFPGILKQVVDESEQSQRQLTISTQTRVDAPLETIAVFGWQFQLAKKEIELVQHSWEAEQGFTMFHVINAYTRSARDATLTVEEAYRLERVAGLILSLVKH